MLGLARQVARETEEREAAVRRALESVSYAQPPALAAWRVSALKDFPDSMLYEMLRAQGALLSLPVLSRRRTEELAALMRRGGFWRFQWALGRRGLLFGARSRLAAARRRRESARERKKPRRKFSPVVGGIIKVWYHSLLLQTDFSPQGSA